MNRPGTPNTGRAGASPDAGADIGCITDPPAGVAREDDRRAVGRPGESFESPELTRQRRHLAGAIDDLHQPAIVETPRVLEERDAGRRPARCADRSSSRSLRAGACRPGTRDDRDRCRGRARSRARRRPATSPPRARPPASGAANCRSSCARACRCRGAARDGVALTMIASSPLLRHGQEVRVRGIPSGWGASALGLMTKRSGGRYPRDAAL